MTRQGLLKKRWFVEQYDLTFDGTLAGTLVLDGQLIGMAAMGEQRWQFRPEVVVAFVPRKTLPFLSAQTVHIDAIAPEPQSEMLMMQRGEVTRPDGTVLAHYQRRSWRQSSWQRLDGTPLVQFTAHTLTASYNVTRLPAAEAPEHDLLILLGMYHMLLIRAHQSRLQNTDGMAG